MKFGVFDHLDDDGSPLGALYESRLQLIEAYERIGIYCYHLAEHHSTPLGMSPSPSVFLASVAQRTKRLRFGPLVYTLSFYNPLRLAEEICMLDHLSEGRFQLGIGRGISPIENLFYGVDPKLSQARYLETYQVLMKALTSKTLSHHGEFHRFDDVPMKMTPSQRPHPPLWYGVANPESVGWVAANKVNTVSLGPAAPVRAITDRYRAEWARLGNDPSAQPLMGLGRHVVIAETDAEALTIAKRAYRLWHASFHYLWDHHNRIGVRPTYGLYPESLDELIARGQAAVGSPATVRAMLQKQTAEAGVNYLLLDLAFGDLTQREVMRSVELFAKQVMPGFEAG